MLYALQSPASDYDVVIVGAGAIGSAAALVLANDGARCLLLEAAPDAIRRYAGEWMHPTVVELMAHLNISQPQAAKTHNAGAGFIVFPEDGTAPIELPYPDKKRGFCCSHYDLAASIRDQAIAHPNVEYIPFARAIDVQRDGRLRFHVADALADREVTAGLIIGAEGRSSVCRRALRPDATRDVVSYMAALSLKDVQLPREGFGHILMGGPGIALAYRVSPDEVRLCFDVPAHNSRLRRDRGALFDAFKDALPEDLREPARAAVHDKSLRWTATFFQPRTERGEDRIVLVGDAVGLCHPLCSAGVAVGLLDVSLLQQAVRQGDLDAYRANGARETWVPELMSCAVYQLLGRPSSGDVLRQTMYRVWRQDIQERNRTMNILTGAERRPVDFVRSFARIGLSAAIEAFRHPQQTIAADSPATHSPATQSALGALWNHTKSFETWLRWPIASVLPPWLVNRIRPRSTINAPY